MELGFPVVTVGIVIVVTIYLLSSIKILANTSAALSSGWAGCLVAKARR